jgi:hypothetical protein
MRDSESNYNPDDLEQENTEDVASAAAIFDIKEQTRRDYIGAEVEEIENRLSDIEKERADLLKELQHDGDHASLDTRKQYEILGAETEALRQLLEHGEQYQNLNA